MSERHIARVDFSTVIPRTLVISPDVRRIAYIARQDQKFCAVVDGQAERSYDGIGEGSLCFFGPRGVRIADTHEPQLRRGVDPGRMRPAEVVLGSVTDYATADGGGHGGLSPI